VLVTARDVPVDVDWLMAAVELSVALFGCAVGVVDTTAVGVGVDGPGVTVGSELELITRLTLVVFPDSTCIGSEYTEQFGPMAA